MLHEKLEHASRETRKRRLRLVLTIAGVTIFAASILANVVLYREVSAPQPDIVRGTNTRSPAAAQSPPDNIRVQRQPDVVEDSARQPLLPETREPVVRRNNTAGERQDRPAAPEPPPSRAVADGSQDRPPRGIDEPPSPTPPAPSASPAVPLADLRSDVPFEQARGPDPFAASDPSTPEPATETTEIARAHPSAADGEAVRQAFKAALRQFQEELEPRIAGQGFINWNARMGSDILFLKDAAVEAFNIGDTKKALTDITKASEMARAGIEDKTRAYETALETARAGKAGDDYETAIRNVETALRLVPGSPEAETLRGEIEALPATLKLLKAADAARAESDLEKEHDLLQQVALRDPSRTAVKQRVTELAHRIAENNFARFIRAGLDRVDARALEKAEANLKAARRIFPDREEVAILAGRVEVLRRDLTTLALLDDAAAAAAKDDWNTSLSLYRQARKIQGDNQRAADGVALASAITTINQGLTDHLAAPHRLSSTNVAGAAGTLLKKANTVAGKSPSLDNQAKALTSMLVAYTTEVPVKVLSDGQTRVSVRGVGRVGAVQSKTIKLKPGTYTFEGVRTGFKSKLVRIEISPGASDLSVEVICDERI